MSYYNPNLYQNYMQSYMMPQMQPQQTMNQMPVQAQPQAAASLLNGKLVDSLDIVKATEVPIGGYGVFPKADLSEIYIKAWNNNGTISITTFKPIVSENDQETADVSNTLIQKMETLEAKLDMIINPTTKTNSGTVKKNEF